jgi:hypothetical protein
MKSIKIYIVFPEDPHFFAPAGAEAISVEWDGIGGCVVVRALADDREPMVTIQVRLVRDGEEVRSGRYIGSYRMGGNEPDSVRHVFI